MVRITTIDPMTGNEVTDLESAPYVIEGTGRDALKIYFENENSKEGYLLFEAENADTRVIDCYNEINSNETMGTIN